MRHLFIITYLKLWALLANFFLLFPNLIIIQNNYSKLLSVLDPYIVSTHICRGR